MKATNLKIGLISTFTVVLILSNIASIKLFEVANGMLILDGGAIIFPLSYILSDTIAECFGFKTARSAVLLALALNLLAAGALALLQLLPPAPGWENQAAYEAILGFFPRVIAGSLVAFACGQIINAGILAKLKNMTKGRWLWLRTLGSSLVADTIDTLLFTTIAFWGVIAAPEFLILIISAFLTKIIGEIILTPVTYLVIRQVKRQIGTDHFDTNFSWRDILPKKYVPSP